jgi:glycosyltransferase involved in cell wall biosynthesis
MRQGQNPAKMGLPAYRPKRLGLALLSFIPSDNGYFAQSLEILKYQIASIHRSTTDFDLMVFDNGSMREVQDQLRQLQIRGLINCLVLSSRNLGKTGALNWILAALPNDMIGFADGDVLFRPGWWEQTERIFSLFPRGGLVTAQPCLFDTLRGTGKANTFLKDDQNYRCFRTFIVPEAVDEYVRGTGLEAQQAKMLKQTPVDFVEERKSSFQVVLGASHMQFVLRRETARRLLPLPAEYALNKDEDTHLNRSVDSMGLLHLSTTLPFVYHMGNRLDENTLAEIRWLGLDEVLQAKPERQMEPAMLVSSDAKRSGLKVLAGLSRWAFFRKTIQRLYNFLFEYYSQAK